MKIRTCPICDQKMESAHYCANCRKWIRTPYEREVSYFLNERHSQTETGCSYHSDVDYEYHAEQASVNKPRIEDEQSAPVSMTMNENAANRKTLYPGTRPFGNQIAMPSAVKKIAINTGKKKKNSFMFVIIMIIVISLIGNGAKAISLLVNNITDKVTEVLEKTEDHIGSTDDEVSNYDDAFVKVDPDQAKKEGKACTAYAHFSVDGEKISALFETTADQIGLKLSEESDYEDFEKDTEYGDTYYNAGKRYYLTDPDYDDDSLYCCVDWDPVSDGVHYMHFYMKDFEKLKVLSTAFMEAAEEEDKGISLSDWDDVLEMLESAETGDDGAYAYEGFGISYEVDESDDISLYIFGSDE